MSRVLPISLLFLFWNSIFSQVYEVTRYADDNGLPSRIVHDVIQDKDGFIWVGGNNGLFKFDGKNFKAFKANLKDTLGLRNNRINTLLESSDGKIWLGTPSGLHVMQNGKIEYVELISNPKESHLYVLSIFEDKQHRIWVGTYNGIFLIEPDNDPIHFLKENLEEDITSGAIWHISQDNQGMIWVATNNGPFLMDPDQYTFEPIALEYDKELSIDEYRFLQNHHLNDSVVLMATSKGLMRGILDTNKRLRIGHLGDSNGKKVADYYVDEFLVSNSSSIYLATWKNGLKKISRLDNQFQEEQMISRNGWKEMSGEVKSVFEDRQNNIWVANTNGLYKISSPKTEIITFPPRYENECLDDFYGIYAILQDQKGYIWTTTPHALYRFSKEDLFSGNCPKEYLHFSDENIFRARDLFIDSQNRLWVSNTNGLFVSQLDAEQNPEKFITYTTADGLPNNWSFEIEEIDENNYWLGTYTGFVKMTLTDGDYKKASFKIFEHDDEAPQSLVNSQVMDVEFDKNGNVWTGTFSGVSRLVNELSSGVFENYTSSFGELNSLSNNSIKEILSDSKGNLWIATQRGLNRYDFEKNQFEQFGHAEGLPSEYVLGLAEDSKGHLWICTTNGVLKALYDDVENKLRPKKHYTSNSGLVDNIPYRNSIFIDEEDNVIIGSRDGISIIKSNQTEKTKETNVGIVLTGMDRIGKKSEGFKSVLDKIEQNSISLPYSENSIQIDYAVLDFIKPENIAYRHKVLPNNETWIKTGNNSQLAYYNLPPGEYEFVLDGSSSLEQWSSKPIRLLVTIKPPFWKSNWAFLIYALVALGCTWLFYRGRIRKKEKEWKRNMAMETAIINEREQLRKENAADFHDELGSMVTKISMFLTMAERNFEEGESPTPFFHKIRDNVKGLSTGFRDLLWVIDPQKDALADTFLRLKEFGEDLFEQSHINFKTSEFQEVFVSRTLNPKTKKQVMMIFKEAMTNCLKHCEGDSAELTLMTNGKFSKMEFSDNGSGFDIYKKSKGRGLKNMRSRAQSIDAIFTIMSSSKGTTITMDRIPHMGDVFSDGQT